MRTRIAALVVLMAAAAGSAAAQDSVDAARELYAAAAYEDALAVLNRLHPADRPAIEARSIEQYRAFCLLALGRAPEAERAIAAVVTGEPLYQPQQADVSPRVRSMFSDVRRRMLPGIVQQRYADAKGAYDRKEFAAAAAGFKDVLALLADPDLAGVANQPPLSDIKTLAGGFRDLAANAAAPPPPPPVLAAPPPLPTVAVRSDPNRIYGAADSNVVPPIVVRQELPPYPTAVTSPMQGAMDVVIDETGGVMAASMRSPVSPLYDSHALAAAKTWRYRPAMMNGAPVKYRKTIQIAITANR
jgi:hypothetical protein